MVLTFCCTEPGANWGHASVPLTENVHVHVRLLSGAFRFRAVCVAVDIGLSESEVLFTLPKWNIALAIPSTSPLHVGLIYGALVLIEFMIVVEKFGSLPNACANSFNVFSSGGASFTRLSIFASTSALVYVVALSAFRSRSSDWVAPKVFSRF